MADKYQRGKQTVFLIGFSSVFSMSAGFFFSQLCSLWCDLHLWGLGVEHYLQLREAQSFLACLEARVPEVIWDFLERLCCSGSAREVKKLHWANGPFISVDRTRANLDFFHTLRFCVVVHSLACRKHSLALSGLKTCLLKKSNLFSGLQTLLGKLNNWRKCNRSLRSE